MKLAVDMTNVTIQDDKVIVDINSKQINSILNSGKVQLSTLKTGDIFKIGNKKFIVLEHTNNGTSDRYKCISSPELL